MAAAPAPVRRPKPGGKGGKGGKGLNAKSIGGAPLWLVIVGGGVLLYIGYRAYESYKANAATTAATTAAAPTDPNAAGGGVSTPDTSALQASLDGLTAALGAGGPLGGSVTPPAAPSPAASAPTYSYSPTFATFLSPLSPSTSPSGPSGPTSRRVPSATGTASAWAAATGDTTPSSTPFLGRTTATQVGAAVNSQETNAQIAAQNQSAWGNFAPYSIPAPPHHAATKVMPERTPKPAPRGPSAKQKAAQSRGGHGAV